MKCRNACMCVLANRLWSWQTTWKVFHFLSTLLLETLLHYRWHLVMHCGSGLNLWRPPIVKLWHCDITRQCRQLNWIYHDYIYSVSRCYDVFSQSRVLFIGNLLCDSWLWFICDWRCLQSMFEVRLLVLRMAIFTLRVHSADISLSYNTDYQPVSLNSLLR